jgi:predicted phage tail protein
MNANLVKVNLFGELGKFMGYETWELNVRSVQEAISALNNITKNKFNEYFIKNNKLQSKYRILINGRDFESTERELNETNFHKINETELIMKKNDLKTIDIVPFIENHGKVGGLITVVLAVILIIVAIVLAPFTGGQSLWLIPAGLALLGAGVVALLSKPPPFTFNQNLDNAVGQSYLFNGPANTVGEGGPVPVGYGTMLVGSNVISAGYRISPFQTVNSN